MSHASTLSLILVAALPAVTALAESKLPKAAVTSMKPEQLAEFADQPKAIQKIITTALELTERNLTYTYASADPDRGGMDCSGTMYHVLRKEGITGIPRQSDHICGWVMKNSTFTRTKDVHRFDHEVFNALLPGDLLFWSGTYEAGSREIPVTHVMLYLGKRTTDGKPVIFGASNGRSYEGQRRCGVSVFDFKVPSAKSKSALYGFGPIPGMRPASPVKKPEEEIRKAKLPTKS